MVKSPDPNLFLIHDLVKGDPRHSGGLIHLFSIFQYPIKIVCPVAGATQTVRGRSKHWTEEQLETGSVLSLVYGKFIDVWRQKEAAVHTNQLQSLLLSNASHEGESNPRLC